MTPQAVRFAGFSFARKSFLKAQQIYLLRVRLEFDDGDADVDALKHWCRVVGCSLMGSNINNQMKGV
jgi:hypothetical protein